MMYTKTVTLCKARHIRNYIAQEIGYNVEFQFDYNQDLVRAVFSCSDDYADQSLCHNADDLNEYIVRRYGAFIFKENVAPPKNFPMDMKKIGEILTNPGLKGTHKDSYQDEYDKIIGDQTWQELKKNIPDITFDERIPTTSYTKDAYKVRFGIWHG